MLQAKVFFIIITVAHICCVLVNECLVSSLFVAAVVD